MKKKFIILLIIPLLFTSFLFFDSVLVFAQGGDPEPQIENPFKSDEIGSSLINFLKFIVNSIILPIGAVIAVVFLIFSGFLFVTAQGNEEKLARAKAGFLWTAVGVAVLLGAWAITEGLTATICAIGNVPGLCN